MNSLGSMYVALKKGATLLDLGSDGSGGMGVEVGLGVGWALVFQLSGLCGGPSWQTTTRKKVDVGS